jgi:hypothetical protein
MDSCSIPGSAGKRGVPTATKEIIVSILKIAVDNHLKQSKLTIRELLEAAYYKRYSKPMPADSLSEDVKKWESGIHTIPYLYDFILGIQFAR